MDDFVFYAWQSDLPKETNKRFIRKALERAIKALNKELPVSDALRADQDTQGVAGDINVAEVIFGKIDKCRIFVADVTTVTSKDARRPMPNPNVLVEYGRASVQPGSSFVVQVFNKAFGDWERDRPFDLRHRRMPVVYELAAVHTDEERKAELASFASSLSAVLRDVLSIPRPAVPLPGLEQFDFARKLYQRTPLKTKTTGRIIGFWIALLPIGSAVHIGEPWREPGLSERHATFPATLGTKRLRFETLDADFRSDGRGTAFSPMAGGSTLLSQFRYPQSHSGDRYFEDTIAVYVKEDGAVAVAVRTNNLAPEPNLNLRWIMADAGNALVVLDRVRRFGKKPQAPYALALEIRYDEQTPDVLQPVKMGNWRLCYIDDGSGLVGRLVSSDPINIGPIAVGGPHDFAEILRTIYVKIVTAVGRVPENDLGFEVPLSE